VVFAVIKCRKCLTIKSKSEFAKNRRQCKKCRSRAIGVCSRKRLYGVTSEMYQEMLLKQNFKCKICDTDNTKYALNVDHCHKSGKVRGLLCQCCNRGIGYLKDSEKILEKAISYLKEHSND